MYKMKKLLAVLALMAGPVFADQSLIEFNEQINATNVVVNRGCSGTVISTEYNLILTNYHCIDMVTGVRKERKVGDDGTVSFIDVEERGDSTVVQRTYKGYDVVSATTYIAKTLKYDREADLAILQLNTEENPYVAEATIYHGDTPLLGTPVWIVGNPLGLDLSVGKGVIASINRNLKVVGFGKTKYFQVDAGVTFGNSGGAMYTMDGDLIGVPGASAPGTVIGLAVPYTEVTKILEDVGYPVVNGKVTKK